MNDNKNLVGLGLLAAAVVALCGVLIWQGHPNISANVTMDGKPVTVSVDGKPVTVNEAPVSGETDQLGTAPGNTTYWNGGDFSEDLVVHGGIYTSGTLLTSGAIVTTGGSFASFHTSTTLTYGSTTLMQVQNTSGRTRTLLGFSCTFPATSTVGTFTYNAGTTTNLGVTSTSPIAAGVLTNSASLDTITVTSSLMTTSTFNPVYPVYAPWKANDYLIVKANTTTQSGVCRAQYF